MSVAPKKIHSFLQAKQWVETGCCARKIRMRFAFFDKLDEEIPEARLGISQRCFD